MKHKNRYFWLLLTLVCALLPSQRASAHTILIRAEPMDGAVVAVAPAVIHLWFNEAIVARFSSVQLLDQANQSVMGVNVQVDPAATEQLLIRLPALRPGTYTLFWKALSAVDGHFSHGFTTLHVGQASMVGTPPPTITDTLPTWPEVGLRWVNYLLLLNLIGALVLLLVVLPTAQTQRHELAIAAQQRLRRRILQWATGSASGAFLLGMGLLSWQVLAAQPLAQPGAVLGASTWLTAGWGVLTQTQWGLIWLARQTLLLLIGGGLWWLTRLRTEPQSSWPWLLLFGRVIELALVQALTGHALGTQVHWLWAVGNATLHFLAAGVWMGGLFVITFCLLPQIHGERHLVPDWQPLRWRNFSLLAVVSTTFLLITGLLSAGQQVAAVDALVTTRYGQVLLGKIGLVLCAGIYGLWSASLVHPTLGNRVGSWLAYPLPWRRPAPTWFCTLLLHEATLGVLILATVGILTTTPPPRTIDYTIDPAAIKPLQGQRVADLIITLEAKPNRLGQNLFNIRINTTAAAPANPVRVQLNFTYLAQPQTTVTALADAVEDNLYQVTGNYLTQAGPWRITVVIQRYGLADLWVDFAWMVPPMGVVQPVLLSKAPLAPILTPIAGLLVVLLLLVARWLRRSGVGFQAKHTYLDSVNVNLIYQAEPPPIARLFTFTHDKVTR